MLVTVAEVEFNQLRARGLEVLAKHPYLYLKPNWAIEIARSDDWAAKCTLAENPVLAQLPDAAMALVTDEDVDVQAALALNLALANLPDVYAELSRSGDEDVIQNFFWNKALVREALNAKMKTWGSPDAKFTPTPRKGCRQNN